MKQTTQVFLFNTIEELIFSFETSQMTPGEVADEQRRLGRIVEVDGNRVYARLPTDEERK